MQDNTGVYIVGVILALGSLSTLYGMVKRRPWFWDPEKAFEKTPLLSMDHVINTVLYPLFGKWGVIIFNILLIIAVWYGFFKFLK